MESVDLASRIGNDRVRKISTFLVSVANAKAENTSHRQESKPGQHLHHVPLIQLCLAFSIKTSTFLTYQAIPSSIQVF